MSTVPGEGQRARSRRYDERACAEGGLAYPSHKPYFSRHRLYRDKKKSEFWIGARDSLRELTTPRTVPAPSSESEDKLRHVVCTRTFQKGLRDVIPDHIQDLDLQSLCLSRKRPGALSIRGAFVQPLKQGRQGTRPAAVAPSGTPPRSSAPD